MTCWPDPLACLSKESKRRTNVFRIFPNDTAITGLAGSQPLKPQEECQPERQRFCAEATMANIPEPEETLEFAGGDPSEQGAATIIGNTSSSLDRKRTPRSPGGIVSGQGSMLTRGAEPSASMLSSLTAPV